ncbi:MAG: hypothetical protein K1X94_08790 [Sandaracinaceae bacterium]|nr:hypothetical protein [Sandaracinaceae bacterium]
MTRWTRVVVLVALFASVGAGCGGGPRRTEVTEPWTSGDEAAVAVAEATPEGATAPGATTTPAGGAPTDDGAH